MSLEIKIVLTTLVVSWLLGIPLGGVSAYLADKTKLKKYDIGMFLGIGLVVMGGLILIGWAMVYLWRL